MIATEDQLLEIVVTLVALIFVYGHLRSPWALRAVALVEGAS